jgi:uncharacterized protein (DUF427 family)
MKAIWNNEVIAESGEAIREDGYYYFPVDSVRKDVLKPSHDTSSCFLKGTANYFHIKVGTKRLANGAWQYQYPSDAAKIVRNRIAFDDNVIIEDAG